MKKLTSSKTTLRHLTLSSTLATLVACSGPVDIDPGDPDGYGVGGQAAEGGGYGTGANGYGTGGWPDETGGAPAAGGWGGGCNAVQPEQTYVCAGEVYESETAGAASLSLISMPSGYACDDSGGYWGAGGGMGVGGSPAGGSAGWGGEPGMDDEDPYYYYPARDESDGELPGLGGAPAAGGGESAGGAPAAGGAVSTGGQEAGGAPGTGGQPAGGAPGWGGQPAGGAAGSGGQPAGGAPGTGGVGGGPNQLSNWCDDARPQDSIAGITFAVGECQAVDVALPLVFREPYYGNYELSIYGGYDKCDRGVLLAKTAGIGTGLVHEIPVDASGYNFVSVQFVADDWQDIDVRLKDRPRVVPSEE